MKANSHALDGRRGWRVALGTVAAMTLCSAAFAQTMVSYGRITAVQHVTQESSKAQTAGAIIGGGIGLLSGRHHSRSNQALRTVGGAFAGQQIGKMTSSRQAYEYTVLIGGTTTRVVTDEAGLRVGDCVAVERGGYNNLRLVEDARCNARPAPKPQPAAIRQADTCIAAKDKLLQAETTEAFDLAERRVRLLCDD
jgi:outer membrane lipoprotein SlyB